MAKEVPSHALPRQPIRRDLDRTLDAVVQKEGGKKYEHLDRFIRIGMKISKVEIAGEGSRA